MHADVVAAPLPELPLRPPAHRVHPRAVTWWRLRAAAGLLVLVVPGLGPGDPGRDGVDGRAARRHGRRRRRLRRWRPAVALPHRALGDHRPRRLHAARLARPRVADRADLPGADRRHRSAGRCSSCSGSPTSPSRPRPPAVPCASAGWPPTTPPSWPASSPRPPTPRRATRRDRHLPRSTSAWRRLDPRMLVVGPLKNLLQLLPFAVVVLLTGPFRRSRPGLDRRRWRRGRRARRRAALADHPLPDHRRARRAAHRLAAPRAPLGARATASAPSTSRVRRCTGSSG